MLRSRDNSKNAHHQTGIQIDDTKQSSSFTKYGILVCILFTIIVAYFVFIDDTTTSINNNSSSSSPSNKKYVTNLSKPKSANTPPKSASFGGPPPPIDRNANIMPQNPSSFASKLTHNAFSAKALHPKILSDLNPMQSDKLERLMNRNRPDRMGRGSKSNKLNFPFGRGLAPLKALTGPQPAFPGTDDGETKEITFTLTAKSLPKAKGRESVIFIRQSYPIRGEFNHDFVLIFLHGAAYTSGTWSELGILSELAKQGYTSYALDIPGYGQSVKTVANNNNWLREIITQLTEGKDDRIMKHIIKAGGVSTVGKKFVIVTASMSGRYAVPLLFNTPQNMIGMITIAPVGTDKFGKDQYKRVTIPVCIIYGEEDTNLGEQSKKNLIQIPNHKLIMVPGGKHAAYKTDPKFFHQQVVKWLTEFFD